MDREAWQATVHGVAKAGHNWLNHHTFYIWCATTGICSTLSTKFHQHRCIGLRFLKIKDKMKTATYQLRTGKEKQTSTPFTIGLHACSVAPVVSDSCNPMDCSLPGFSVHGVLQASILEWVAISFSRGSSWPRDWTQVPCIAGRLFTFCATREFQPFY